MWTEKSYIKSMTLNEKIGEENRWWMDFLNEPLAETKQIPKITRKKQKHVKRTNPFIHKILPSNSKKLCTKNWIQSRMIFILRLSCFRISAPNFKFITGKTVWLGWLAILTFFFLLSFFVLFVWKFWLLPLPACFVLHLLLSRSNRLTMITLCA